MPGFEISAGHAAFLQIATAVVQAMVSIGLLTWYVLAAHAERVRKTRERAEEFESLVMLCRGLGLEAQARILTCQEVPPIAASASANPDQQLKTRIARWKTDMEVIYVCLNEVPHYEVRSPAFSIALTRLWLEVDARALEVSEFNSSHDFDAYLEGKYSCIGWEIDAMAQLLNEDGVSGAAVQRTLADPVRRAENTFPSSRSERSEANATRPRG